MPVVAKQRKNKQKGKEKHKVNCKTQSTHSNIHTQKRTMGSSIGKKETIIVSRYYLDSASALLYVCPWCKERGFSMFEIPFHVRNCDGGEVASIQLNGYRYRYRWWWEWWCFKSENHHLFFLFYSSLPEPRLFLQARCRSPGYFFKLAAGAPAISEINQLHE